jgi:hypothetical protein
MQYHAYAKEHKQKGRGTTEHVLCIEVGGHLQATAANRSNREERAAGVSWVEES